MEANRIVSRWEAMFRKHLKGRVKTSPRCTADLFRTRSRTSRDLGIAFTDMYSLGRALSRCAAAQ